MSKISLCLLFLLAGFASCKKDTVDAQQQAQIDETTIKNFLVANNLQAQREEHGVYYIITDPGSGSVTYNANTQITAKYSLRLLNGMVIPQGLDATTFTLGNVIAGWKLGIPLIQPGGHIRLIVPSGLAYGTSGTSSIPANACLDFDIELINATN